MVAVEGPQIDAVSLNQPLPQIKKQILTLVSQAQSRFLAQQKGPYSKEYLPVFKQILRISLLSLISGFGFAALAWNPKTNKSLLTSWLDALRSLARALGLTGAKRSSPKWLAAMRKKFELARVKLGRWNRAKQRGRDKNLQTSEREKEIKRRQNERFKLRLREFRNRHK